MSEAGPAVSDLPIEEMGVEDITHSLIYTRMAWRQAREEDDAPQEVLDALMEQHDELFCYQAAMCPYFVENYRKRNYYFLDHYEGVHEKYDALVDAYAPSAN